MNHLKKHGCIVFFLFAASNFIHAQNLIWESDSKVRPRHFNLSSNYLGGALGDELSILKVDNFDNDNIADLVVTQSTENGLFVEVIPTSAKNIHFDVEFGSPEGPYKFIGFLTSPTVNNSGNPDPEVNQMLFGLERENRIIGILVGFKSQGTDKVTIQELSVDDDYAFMGAYDVNNNGISELMIYNTNTETLQLWEYSTESISES